VNTSETSVIPFILFFWVHLPFTNFHLCFLRDECLCWVVSVVYLAFVVIDCY
jgi:hypothetical protein